MSNNNQREKVEAAEALAAEAVEYLKKHGTAAEAARQLGVARSTFRERILLATRIRETPKTDVDQLKLKVRRLESELLRAHESNFDEKAVRDEIIKLSSRIDDATIPEWMLPLDRPTHKSPGIPTLFASDWHFGEIVDPTQIGGVNSYNMSIARQRAKLLIETTIDLLDNHMVNPDYPGIVFALGGDMVSGDIHDELMATNEMEIMPVVVELFGILTWCIETLADRFGKVFCPCVGGNHGRNTQKIRAKGRNFTSFDWLTYAFLAKRFEGDARVSFMIPNGPDALYRVYEHRYLLTHGDAYRGGDGLIGCLGPIIRGDHKKRSRNNQIDQGYDTQLMGHFHQLIQLERVIVNGSLKGYCEYASANNFGFEPPRQALWITHPRHGITFSMPVNVDKKRKADIKTDWVSWAK